MRILRCFFDYAEKKGASKSRNPAMLHRYSCRPPKDSRSRRGWDLRAEFLTTARILSLAGQLVAAAFPERGSIFRLLPSCPWCILISIPSLPLSLLVASFSARSRPSLFPPIPLYPSSPMNAFGSQEGSFSSFRNATLRPPLFSRRIASIFRFLFQVLRTTVQSGLQADFVNLEEVSRLECSELKGKCAK
jgi:hypothetical protein